MTNELELKYGCNPNQKPARIFIKEGELPIEVLNGRPGYINLLDALNSWQLVKELKEATGLPAAASFKHVSPAGAAVAVEMNDTLKKIYFVDDMELSPMATAYARARGADRMSSYGDFIALSDICDEPTARIINREVSDGVIAPGYTPEALEILRNKRKGTYNVIKINPAYRPAPIEHKDVFGITFEQGRNELKIDESLLKEMPTRNRIIPADAQRTDHFKIYTIQLCLLCQRRTSYRHRCRTAITHSLYPPGRKQSRYLVFAPTSESNESALERKNTPCRPRQYNRCIHLGRLHGRTGRWCMGTILHPETGSADP